MAAQDMSLGRNTFRSLLSELSPALKSFQSSSSKFRILHTVNPSSKTTLTSPKTLLILDSSYNPPSRAHLSLAKSALHESSTRQYKAPFRLLLLFSTHNADKAPSAASFPERLALMTVFAEDLLQNLEAESPNTRDQYTIPHIDIGVTTAPYYTDKSAAVTKEGMSTYPDKPIHVHLLGFDTITRFFAAKYYPSFDPPFSALEPFFNNGHRLRVTLRPSDEYGTVEQQRAFVQGLADGKMEKDGGKRIWADQVELVEAGDGVGVSSTRVRKAAKAGQWKEVQKLCTKGIAEAVRTEGVYESDDRGSKMA